MPAIPEAIRERAAHPAYGYFSILPGYYEAIRRWQQTRNGAGELPDAAIGYENGVLGGVVSALRALVPQGGPVLVHSPTYIGFTAVLRRAGKTNTDTVKEVKYDKLSINLTNYELKVNGVQVDTPPKEMELIYHLASNPNRVFTRDQLLDEVWGFDYYGDSRTVDVHVKRLREKLEGVSDKWSLKTVWGVGYKFEVKE